jgi:hypothetical protein
MHVCGAAVGFGAIGIVALGFLLLPASDLVGDGQRLARPTGVLVALGWIALSARAVGPGTA